jgi:alkyl sulfatase BDS1-like metallo-beta-lactamase superfamily hydrolase
MMGREPPAPLTSVPNFDPRVVRVGRAYCALDYAMSNCTAVQVAGGYVLIDTGPDVTAGAAIRAALETHVRGELLGIIYTHAHADHIFGAPAFWKPGVPIYAQERFFDEGGEQRKLVQALCARGARQFGLRLPPEHVTTTGIGPPLRAGSAAPGAILLPTHTFRDALDLDIGGVRFELRHAPGETHDHLSVWLPQERTLIAGDNIYKAFPNIATIRGSSPRPVEGWIRSLDRMRYLDPAPEHLILGHTDPVSGAETIRDLLTAYRDAIAFVHNSVVRLANQGHAPHELVRLIRLPQHLRTHPYLAEVYGTVAGSVRGIYAGYLGWFDGNASNLDPLPPSELASRLLPKLGGRAAVLALMRGSVESDPRWVAWLADVLLAIDARDREARALKASALTALAGTTNNPLHRHWYLHDAAVLSGTLPATEKVPLDPRAVELIPIDDILAQIPYRILPDHAADITMTVGYDFPDSGKRFTLFIRRGVGELVKFLAPNPDLVLRATEADFKRAFVTRTLSPFRREFWRAIKFEIPVGGVLAPLRAVRLLLRLDRCVVRP